MAKPKVYLKADASAAIGYGHFIRTLALANMLNEDFDCFFFTSDPTEFQKGEVAKVCSLHPLFFASAQDDFLSFLSGDEIVVLDNYYYTSDYQKRIKDKGCKLVCIDDIPEKHFYADIVINHSLGLSADDYECESYTKICIGTGYLLLRKEFFAATKDTVPKTKGSIFICYGGSDEYDFTFKTCQVLRQLDSCHIIAVVGGGYTNRTHLEQYAKDNNISVFSNIYASKMIQLMSSSSLAIVPASTTFFETCCARIPIITGYTVDNQMFIATSCEAYNLGYNCGNFHDEFEKKLKAAYSFINKEKAEEYISSQQRLINDSSENILNIFRKLC